MKPENVTCPKCGGPMVSRLNRAKQQRFWGCKLYPTCTGTRDTDGNAQGEEGPDDDCREEQDSWPSKGPYR